MAGLPLPLARSAAGALTQVADKASQHKMTANNLAVCFAPTIISPWTNAVTSLSRRSVVAK
jgi:hypothetical protein